MLCGLRLKLQSWHDSCENCDRSAACWLRVGAWRDWMTFLRRRLTLSIVVVLVTVLAIPAIWLGAKWNRALSNVDKMIVPTVALPSATAGARSSGSGASGAAPDAGNQA